MSAVKSEGFSAKTAAVLAALTPAIYSAPVMATEGTGEVSDLG